MPVACLGRCYVQEGIKEDEGGGACSEDDRNYESIQIFFSEILEKMVHLVDPVCRCLHFIYPQKLASC